MTNDLKNASALQIVLRTYEFLSLASYIKNLMTRPNVAKMSFFLSKSDENLNLSFYDTVGLQSVCGLGLNFKKRPKLYESPVLLFLL